MLARRGEDACDMRLIQRIDGYVELRLSDEVGLRRRASPVGQAAAIALKAARSEQWRESPPSLVCSVPAREGNKVANEIEAPQSARTAPIGPRPQRSRRPRSTPSRTRAASRSLGALALVIHAMR
jgi:hypothetical protein